MYSVNQVKQLYVVDNIKEPAQNETVAVMESTDAAGTLVPKVHTDGSFVYFQYKNVDGDVMATDRIKKCKVKWITFIEGEAMRKNKKKTVITLTSDGSTAVTPVVGQDYIINFSFRNYFGMSDEDTYEKHAVARAMSTDPSELLAELAVSLAKNMSREIDQPFVITADIATTAAGSASSHPEVTKFTKVGDLSNDSNKFVKSITLTEKEQPWALGRMQQTRPEYTIHFVPIVNQGVENYKWGYADTTEAAANGQIKNGADTANFEWFCMGERGDQYRGKDWPLSITTPASLVVNAAKEYDYLTIHFWDDIDNEGPQKSERDMIFITDNSGSNNDLEDIAEFVCKSCGLGFYTKTYMDSSTKTSVKVDVTSSEADGLKAYVDSEIDKLGD